MKKYILSPILILFFLLQPISSTLAQSAQGNNYSVVQITGANFSNLLNDMGITIYEGEENTYIAIVDDGQLSQIQSYGVPFVVLKSNASSEFMINSLAINSDIGVNQVANGQLQNSYLSVLINNKGQFTMQDSTERYLLYPSPTTSYLSINIDGQIYTNYDSSLTIITPLTILDSNRGYIVFQTPEKVQIRLNYTLMDLALQLKIDFKNTDDTAHWVKARYLLDTQVDINDGSPLYAPPVGVRTRETDLSNPSFTMWKGYDVWPNPSLTSIGTISTTPYRLVFAHWPRAIGYRWDYSVDPLQVFFTPEYTTSPYSDSCVLEYFDVGALPINGTGQIITYYGLGAPTGVLGREQLIDTYKELRNAINASLDDNARSFSRSLSVYYSTMDIELDAKWYIESGWDMFSLFLPNPYLGRSRLMRNLSKDFKTLNEIAEVVTLTDYGTQLSLSIAQLFKTIPSGLNADQINNEYILPYIMDHHQFGSYQGINGIKRMIDDQFQTTINAIPDPLPSSYPVDTVVANIRAQTYALRRSIYTETSVPFISNIICMNDVKAGVINNLENEMISLSDRIETADSFQFAMTVEEIGIWSGAAAVKIASIAGVVTGIPGEAVFWGSTAAIATVPEIFGAAGTVYSITNKGYFTGESYKVVGQLASDTKMLTSLFQSSSEYIRQPVNLLLRDQTNTLQLNQFYLDNSVELNFLSIQIPNVLVENGEIFSNGSGTITLQNNSSTNISVSIYGDITAQSGNNIEIIGLLGTEDPVTIQPREIKELPFTFVVLRSSLVHFTGYDLNIHASFLKEGTAERGSIGPFVSHIFAGTQDQLSAWNNNRYQNLYFGQLTEGNVYTQNVHATPGTNSSRFVLSFDEVSDLDLHLYDSLGRHSGMNYQTGIVESQIPGVTYSGPTSWPEWILLDTPNDETYQVEVIATSTPTGGNFNLSQLDIMPTGAMVDTAGQVLWSFIRLSSNTSQSENYDFTVTEVGGTSSVQINSVTPSDFQSSTDVILPASKIVCSSNALISAGGLGAFNCKLSIDPNTRDGAYKGQIQISGQSPDGTLISTKLNVTIVVISPAPTLPVLDNFNRANGTIGTNWLGNKTQYRISNNQLLLNYYGTKTDIFWKTAFGADQEAYVTFSKISPTTKEQSLLLKAQSNRTWGNGVIEVQYSPKTKTVQVWTYEWPKGWVKYGDDIPVTFVNGDVFGARARADGIVEIYRNGELLGTCDITAWSYYAKGGYIGLWIQDAKTTILDDFGGGTVPAFP